MGDTLLSWAWWGGWVILRFALREHAITLAGPTAATFIDPISPDDLREAAVAILQGWTKPILENPSEISGQAYQSYTVLTVCRILYTLQMGSIVSRAAAALWARANLDQCWAPLVERAWIGRQQPQPKANPHDVTATLDFVRYVLERSPQFEIKGIKL